MEKRNTIDLKMESRIKTADQRYLFFIFVKLLNKNIKVYKWLH